MTATEVARGFSEVISRVGAGEEVEVVRNGAAVAQLSPIRGPRVVSADRWRELMGGAPAVDDDFEHDVEEVRKADWRS